MAAIWKRMQERDKEQWRRVYKSMSLLEYLLRNGSDQVIPEARVHSTLLHSLTEYYHQADGKDQGLAGTMTAIIIIIVVLLLLL